MWDRPVDAIKHNPTDFVEAVHPEDRSLVERTMAELSSGSSIDFEFRILDEHGEARWIWAKGEPICDDSDDIIRLVGFSRDITERKTHEEELETEREFIDQALDTLNDVFYVLGSDGRLERWNRRLEQITGRSSEEIAETSAIGFFPVEERDRILAAINETLVEGHATVEANIETSDGTLIPHEFTGRRLTNAAGEVLGLVGIGRNITTRKERKRELKETKSKYEAVVEQSNDGIRIVQDGTVIFVNERFAELVGRPKGELLGKPADAFVAPEYKETLNAHRKSRLSGEDGPSPNQYELELETTSGDRRAVEISVTKIEYHGVPASLSIFRDIEERKQREKQLQRNVRRFEAMFNDPNILVGLLETDGTVIDVNETALSYIDHELDAIVGSPLWETPWFDGDVELKTRVRECIEQAAKGEYVPFEFDLTRAVGTNLIVDGVFRPVTDEAGNVTSLLISDRDVTTQRQREAELELRTHAIDEAPVGIVITDPNELGNPITYVNNGFCELTQYTEAEVLGRDFGFLQGPLTEDDSKAALRAAIDNREPITRDILNYRKDGTPFWNNVQITPVFDDSGDLRHFIGFQTDITTRVEQERRTELLQQTLRHNIRNDLTVILGNLALIEDEYDDELGAARDAREAAIRLLELSESARRIEAHIKQASFVPNEVDIETLIADALSPVNDSSETVTLDTSIDADASVLAPKSVSIAIRELVINAIRHASESDPNVFVSMETGTVALPPDDSRRSVVTIHIEDRNPPISDLELTRLFGEDESPIQHGTGLGLWLVHWMVTMSGGLISHEPVEPDGNRISITLLQALDSA